MLSPAGGLMSKSSYESQTWSRSLVLIATMICKSLRSNFVLDNMVGTFDHDLAFGSDNVNFALCWGDLSRYVLSNQCCPLNRNPIPKDVKDLVNSEVAATGTVGLVKNETVKKMGLLGGF
ncbi:hypothetical protein OROHE_023072 [Orobanche hederae]